MKIKNKKVVIYSKNREDRTVINRREITRVEIFSVRLKRADEENESPLINLRVRCKNVTVG